LKAVQQYMVAEQNLCRNVVNHRISRIKRVPATVTGRVRRPRPRRSAVGAWSVMTSRGRCPNTCLTTWGWSCPIPIRMMSESAGPGTSSSICRVPISR
jgi:hypothetical protein